MSFFDWFLVGLVVVALIGAVVVGYRYGQRVGRDRNGVSFLNTTPAPISDYIPELDDPQDPGPIRTASQYDPDLKNRPLPSMSEARDTLAAFVQGQIRRAMEEIDGDRLKQARARLGRVDRLLAFGRLLSDDDHVVSRPVSPSVPSEQRGPR